MGYKEEEENEEHGSNAEFYLNVVGYKVGVFSYSFVPFDKVLSERSGI